MRSGPLAMYWSWPSMRHPRSSRVGTAGCGPGMASARPPTRAARAPRPPARRRSDRRPDRGPAGRDATASPEADRGGAGRDRRSGTRCRPRHGRPVARVARAVVAGPARARSRPRRPARSARSWRRPVRPSRAIARARDVEARPPAAACPPGVDRQGARVVGGERASADGRRGTPRRAAARPMPWPSAVRIDEQVGQVDQPAGSRSCPRTRRRRPSSLGDAGTPAIRCRSVGARRCQRRDRAVVAVVGEDSIVGLGVSGDRRADRRAEPAGRSPTGREPSGRRPSPPTSRSWGRAWAVIPSRPIIVSAATSALTIASSVASIGRVEQRIDAEVVDHPRRRP